MIKRIFQDLDECIISSHDVEQFAEGELLITKESALVELVTADKNIVFHLRDEIYGNDLYHTYIRPSAKRLFEFYNSVVGKENVYILTTSIQPYARMINKLADFGVDHDHIISREEIHVLKDLGTYEYALHDLANSDNVLIDNLKPHENRSKISIMDIKPTRYHQTPNYFGDNKDDAEFEAAVRHFIMECID